MKKEINLYLSTQNLDIRKKGRQTASRFMDQKVTPDILSVICNAIISLDNNTFTSGDIWDSSEFATSMKLYFGKGDVNLDDFKNEYDKVIGQCLNTLNFSRIISLIGKKGRSNLFEILNRELLLFISSSDRNSYIFLLEYLKETLKQSDFINQFENFFNQYKITNTDYVALKDNFDKFMKENTNISSSNIYETRRIFSKVINPLAVDRNSLGSRSGRLSKDPIIYQELLYNRTNWRDIGKPKGISRAYYRDNQSLSSENARKYSVEKAKKNIKNYHRLKNDYKLDSEIKELAIKGSSIHAHHIFPENEFEELSDTLENIILLTSGQHFSHAHPNGNTSIISRNYQKKCLLSKLKTILDSKYSELYSIDSFIEVLEIGLNISINKSLLIEMNNNEKEIYLMDIIKKYYDNYSK